MPASGAFCGDGGYGLAQDFLRTAAAVLAANLVTLAFIGAWLQAQRDGGFKHSTITWAGLLMPLIFIVLVMLSIGPPSPHGG